MEEVTMCNEEASLFPPKPEEPRDSECCGTGCTPCVFDIYKKKLKRWEEECEKIGRGEDASSNVCDNNLENNDIISQYEYANFIVKEIIKDCLSFKLGQHVVLRIEGKSRQYTVLDVRKDGSFTVIFKIYETGLLTPLVDKLAIGSKVEMRGPFGKEFLYKPNTYNNLVMIGAGTGIAPFCRIIDLVLENENDETRILLLYACRNENEVLLLYKMKEWARSWNFKIQYFLSNVTDKNKAQSLHYGMKVACGKIDKTVIENLEEIKMTNNNLYLICGTKSFDKDILNHLKSVGANEESIKLF